MNIIDNQINVHKIAINYFHLLFEEIYDYLDYMQ